MIEISRAETDDDLDAWRRVRLAILPQERAPSVEELRAADAPERLLLLARLDGDVCGSGTAGKSDLAGRATLMPRVLPWARRRGVGTMLLRALGEHVESLGYREVGSGVEERESLAFATRFGFREHDRQVEQVRIVGDEAVPSAPPGVSIVSVAERPELWRSVYDTVAQQAFEDMALDTPLEISLDQWEREWITCPEATFVALAVDDGRVLGCAGLQPDADAPGRAENALTAVDRDWRGRGIATALKRTALAWAADNGIREVYTWTQSGNDEMRRLNERLGYVLRSESISLRAPLPLPVR
jgi:GNAT superfamily N-acetyltransferase